MGLNGFTSRQMLAEVLRRQQRKAAAFASWLAVNPWPAGSEGCARCHDECWVPVFRYGDDNGERDESDREMALCPVCRGEGYHERAEARRQHQDRFAAEYGVRSGNAPTLGTNLATEGPADERHPA